MRQQEEKCLQFSFLSSSLGMRLSEALASKMLQRVIKQRSDKQEFATYTHPSWSLGAKEIYIILSQENKQGSSGHVLTVHADDFGLDKMLVIALYSSQHGSLE